MALLSTRDAYERYADAMNTRSKRAPVKFDSFRRWLNQGRVKIKKRGHWRLVESASLTSLINVELDKGGRKPLREPAKTRRALPEEKHAKKTSRKRKSRGAGYQSQLLEGVWDKVGSNYVAELQQTGKRPPAVQELLEASLGSDTGAKSVLAYLTELERRATAS